MGSVGPGAPHGRGSRVPPRLPGPERLSRGLSLLVAVNGERPHQAHITPSETRAGSWNGASGSARLDQAWSPSWKWRIEPLTPEPPGLSVGWSHCASQHLEEPVLKRGAWILGRGTVPWSDMAVRKAAQPRGGRPDPGTDRRRPGLELFLPKQRGQTVTTSVKK